MKLPSPYQGNEKYIFISYSHKDTSRVGDIICRLSEQGYRVWYDSGIVPGSEWDENIATHIENCGCFIAFMSDNYLKSNNCKDELKYARDLEKDMLVIYLEKTNPSSGIKMRINRIQSVSKYAYESDKDFYEKLFSVACLEQCMTATNNESEAFVVDFGSSSCDFVPTVPLDAEHDGSSSIDRNRDKILPLFIVKDSSCSMHAQPMMLYGSGLNTLKFKKRMSPEFEPPRADSVQFSAVFQEKAEKGKYLPINIIMYEDEYRFVVDRIKESINYGSKEVFGGFHDVGRNSRVKVVLSSFDLQIGEQTEERVWNGKYLNFEFAVMFPDDYNKKQALLTATVYIDAVILTKLNLIIDYEEGAKPDVSMTRYDVKSVFVSYASEDREAVSERILGMQKVREDLDIFFDIENLKSGQIWEEKLKSEIENRDILYLCWSKNAKKSEWVDKEWRYALEKKGEDYIDPLPIDPPEECPPPPELNKKHFNDKMLYIIKALKAMDLSE